MPVYVEKIKDKKTGKMVDKIVDGKKQYFIRTYVEDELGNSKQITRHNKDWIGNTGKKEAEREEGRLINNHNISNIQKDKNITLSNLKSKYLESIKLKIDKDTLKAKTTKLNHFCENDSTNQVKTYPDKNIKLFDKENYKKWQEQMLKKKYKKNKHSQKPFPYSIKHLNNIHNEICSMLDYGITEGYCKINFAKQAGKFGTSKEIKMSKMDKTYETIDFDEYKRLLSVSKNDLKYNTYFDLAFTRGPRPGEIRAFKVKDFDNQKKQLMVNHTMSKNNKLKEPKTASSKAPIDLDDELNNKIKLLIDKLKQQSGFNEEWYLFGNENPISSHALEYARDKYFKLANIDKYLRLHDFRHSCATWLFSIGVPITVISKILRHANIKETMKTYTHLLNKDYENSLDFINNFKIQDQKQDQK